MPNKRNHRKNTPKFYCPHCHRRLWRLGGPKYYLSYQGSQEIHQEFKVTGQKASCLASQQSTGVDRQTWIEEYFCENHGKIWMRIFPSDEGLLWAKPAQREDWQKTGYTFLPDGLHGGVSQFTARASRNKLLN